MSPLAGAALNVYAVSLKPYAASCPGGAMPAGLRD